MQPEQYAQKWFCDCEKHCKGRTKVVSRSTFQRHAQFRKPAFPNESGCGQSLPAPPHVASATATGEPGLSPQGTRESARAQAVASAIGMSAPGQPESETTSAGDFAGEGNSVAGSVGDREESLDEPLGGHYEEVEPDPGSLGDSEYSANEHQESTPPFFNVDELLEVAKLEDIKVAITFIQILEGATLDGPYSCLAADTVERLRNPPKSSLGDFNDPDLRLGLDLFLATINASQNTYSASRDAILRRHPNDEVPSYEQIKQRIAEITGVVAIVNHMCANSCAAFTGPFAELSNCPACGESRYHSSGAPKQELHTIPLGPQLQALYRDSQMAKDMSYRRIRTKEVIEELQRNDGVLEDFEDFLHGQEYLEAVRAGRITENDILLMLSIDGAQLYAHKASDCWICLWIIFEQAPEMRYKKKHVLPAFTIPGPNNPKIIDSYLFPSLYHLSALQREGLPIWDAWRNVVFISRPFFALGTADGPAMSYLNGLVGYKGKLGCRLYCPVIGRHKPGASRYYPALFKPLDSDVRGCNHGDISYTSLKSCSLQTYHSNLRYIMAAANDTQYKKRRLETGISKPSIFLGLLSEKTFPVPNCFGSDIMHLLSLNIPDLLINLWRGTLDCDKNDNRVTWDWAVLNGATWQRHGAQVASATPYLPGSFDRPPRNPAEKISSGYKAWEFLIYLFGLGPGLLYNVLPEKYWINFCKLVFGVRIIQQLKIKATQAQLAHNALLEFACEFELLYYQRRIGRLHFVRQSIHAVAHLAPEVIRIGPPACSSQWTMERTIGNLGQEIRQPSNPFANLSRRALQRCQINALKAMIPDLEKSPSEVPRGAKALGDGYVLLRAKDRASRAIQDRECEATIAYLNCNHNILVSDDWSPTIIRWARLRLRNGQVARSAWKEKLKPLEKVRMARNIKVPRSLELLHKLSLSHRAQFYEKQVVQFAEVYYYFQMVIGNIEQTLAMVSVYSPPHAALLTLSHNTLWSCTYHGNLSLKVINVKSIDAVIAMVPHQLPEDSNSVKRFFVVEKPGLDVASLGGVTENVPEEE